MQFLTFFTNLLHFLPTETSHNLGLRSLKLLHMLGVLKYFFRHSSYLKASEIHLNKENHHFLGKFPNKLGIAAGLDKNGDFIDTLADLCVGFIEIGTVTPKPQKGNKQPRLFRDSNNLALINRMGFNNKGVDYLISKIKERRSNIPLGISIGKNFDTALDKAYEDYMICLRKVYKYADYIAINISSPNTENLRNLSSKNYFEELLSKLKNLQTQMSYEHGYRPLFIKISPDEDTEQILQICKAITNNSIDGIICTNTSVDHKSPFGSGGISGKPLMACSTNILKEVRSIMGEEFPIIASGGVMSALDYQNKIQSGANLVQIYTGFIYKGPKLIDDILKL